jgi:hypothetical protein
LWDTGGSRSRLSVQIIHVTFELIHAATNDNVLNYTMVIRKDHYNKTCQSKIRLFVSSNVFHELITGQYYPLNGLRLSGMAQPKSGRNQFFIHTCVCLKERFNAGFFTLLYFHYLTNTLI